MSNRSGRSDRYDWGQRHARANFTRRERTSTSTKDSYLQGMRRRDENLHMICLFTMHRIEGGIGQNTHNVIVLTHRTLAPQLILGWIQSVSIKYRTRLMIGIWSFLTYSGMPCVTVCGLSLCSSLVVCLQTISTIHIAPWRQENPRNSPREPPTAEIIELKSWRRSSSVTNVSVFS